MPPVFCIECARQLPRATAKFCSSCKAAQIDIETVNSSDVEILEDIVSFPSSIQPTQIPSQSSRAQTISGSSISAEVRNAKAKANSLDYKARKEGTPQSGFGVDPRGKGIQRRTVELFLVERGASPVRLPGGAKQMRLDPSQQIDDWSEWVRKEAYEFTAWVDRKDPANIIEDHNRKAWLSAVTGNNTAEVSLKNGEDLTLGSLLLEIPEKDGKVKIGFMIPIRNLDKEMDEEASKSLLSVPQAKRQKSPTGDPIKKGRGNSKGKQVKEERAVKKEGAVKEEVEVEDKDINNVNSLRNGAKRKR